MNPLETSHLTLLDSQRCPKLLTTAQGQLTFNVWQDNDTHDLHLALSHNEGGGYFSNELLSITRIMDCLSVLKTNKQAFPAVRLKSVFEGKSANNASFLGAVLRHLNVLVPCPENTKLHLVCEDLESLPVRLSALKVHQSEVLAANGHVVTSPVKVAKSRAKNALKESLAPACADNLEADTTTDITITITTESDDERHS